MSNQTEQTGSESKRLFRYTDLPATIHLLETKSITLLNPKTWDDKNDAFFLNQYKRQKKAKSVLTLCFSKAKEKYHHWKVFAGDVDGVRIEFDRESLLKGVRNDARFKSGKVIYKKTNEIKLAELPSHALPFLKRITFKDDKEYRVIFVDYNKHVEYKQANIDLNCIRRITLSPWMSKTVAKSVKRVLKKIEGCGELTIYHSKLIDNPTLKK